MTVRNRRDMAQFLEDRMTRSYHALREEQRLPFETTLVKTYLVECHGADGAGQQALLGILRHDVAAVLRSERAEARVHETDEEGFFCLEVARGEDKVAVTVYVDASDPRFWMLHSMASSTEADWVFDRMVTGSPALDAAWLPAELLEFVVGLGSFRGLGLDFDRREVPDVDFESPEAPHQMFKMQFWGNRAADLFRLLRESKPFAEATTLSKVKVHFRLDGEGEGFTIDDVKYNGKITARGTSFQSHTALTTALYRQYRDRVRLLQEEVPLKARSGDGRVSLSGLPVNIRFSGPIADVGRFCDSVFSCAPPFRLWGLPARVSGKCIRVTAVDLHVGGRLDFEIFEDYLRVYLRGGCCANTLLRLYTNLQHHYDATTRANLGDGRPLLQL